MLLTLLLAAIVAASGPVAAEPLNVVAFNVHLGVGPQGTRAMVTHFLQRLLHAVARRPTERALLSGIRKVGRLLRERDADVAVLNEFPHHGLLTPFSRRRSERDPQANGVAYILSVLRGEERLAGTGMTWEAHYAPYVDGRFGQFGNLILVRTGGQVAAVESFDTYHFRNLGRLRGYERLFYSPPRRNVVMARIVLANGRHASILGTHLEHNQDRSNVMVRRRQMREIQSLLEGLPGEDAVFLMGDLNAIPPEHYTEPERAGDVKEFAEDAPGKETGEPYRLSTIQLADEVLSSSYRDFSGSFDRASDTAPGLAPRVRIDYIYYRFGPAGGTLLDASVLHREPEASEISDHLPVEARVDLPAAPPAR